MLALKFTFERGRYHATQWRRNVNEGIVDWPPSPWRIVRAIISSWKTYHADIPDGEMWEVVRKLLAPPVAYNLPPAMQSHTRHYVPTKMLDKSGNVKTTLMLDTFVVVGKSEPVHAVWENAELDDTQAGVLAKVVGTIRYLGRAESMCHVSIETDHVNTNCRPLGSAPPGSETGDGGTASPGPGHAGGGLRRADAEITEVLVPRASATLDDLCVRTGDLHGAGLEFPPNTSLVAYERPAGSLSAVPRSKARHKAAQITAVRYRIDASPRPLLTESMSMGDALKRAAMSWYRQVRGDRGTRSATLSGMSPGGGPLRDSHSHAFYLPTDDDGDRRLDHLTVVSRTPFTEDEAKALANVRFVRHGGHRLRITFLRRGSPGDFALPMLGLARRWVSATPYVPNRHTSVHGKGGGALRVKDSPQEQIAREIRLRKIGDVKSVDISPAGKRLHGFLPVQFKTWRKPGLPGFGSYIASIEFDAPVRGPISLGHGSHYGMGLFVPAGGKESQADGDAP